MRKTLLFAAFVAAFSFASAAAAQTQVFGGPDDGRKASTLIFADTSGGFTPKGGVSINYSQPEWKADYDAVLASGKFNGTNQRLGKNWWTSLDTTVALDIGGTKIAPGSYYLGLQIGKDGAVSLLVLDAKTANQHGWMPFVAAAWKTETVAKLELHKDSLKDVQAKMTIAITADEKDPTKGKFSVQWGKHELVAAVAFHLDGGKHDDHGKHEGEHKGEKAKEEHGKK